MTDHRRRDEWLEDLVHGIKWAFIIFAVIAVLYLCWRISRGGLIVIG